MKDTVDNGLSALQATRIPISWHSELPIYASEHYLKSVGDEYGWLGGFDESRHLRCILPFTVIRKAGFRIIRFRVETIPVAENLEVAEERSFLNSVVEHFRAMGAHLIVPASNNTIFRTYPQGAVFAPYGTYINDLEQPEPDLWKQVSEAYRKDIRRAMKAGVEIKSGFEYVEVAHRIVVDTLKRSGLKFMNVREFKNLVEHLGSNAKIFVAMQQDVVLAALLAPFSGYGAFALYGGTIVNPGRGAMPLLHWQAMRTFQALGVRRFNFTGVRINPERGSKQEGILTFKQRFGGELVRGYMWKYALRRLQFVTYNVGVRFLRGGDVVDKERHKLVLE